VAVLLVGAAVRLWLARRNVGITMDSPLYVRMAEALRDGLPAVGPAHHGYPALVALAGLVLPGREIPGRVVSFVLGVALVPLVHALARRTMSAGWASLAAGLVALHPLLAVYSGPIMTESTFLACASAALLAVEARRFLSGGLGLGLAYAVRPEALVIAIGAAAFGGGGWRGAARLLGGFAVVVAPYAGFLSWQEGVFTLSPKTVLIRPPHQTRGEVEWRIRGERDSLAERGGTLPGRIRDAAPAVAARYLPNLADHVGRLLEVWPWPLAALGVVGLARRRGPLIGPLLGLTALPLLDVAADFRFSQIFVPALAVYAAGGGAWIAGRFPRPARIGTLVALALALAGIGLSWSGRAGRQARWFDDGPMAHMRMAGMWLAHHGRAGATVMDRKAYVPFFAGMRHVQLPDDDVDVVIEYARASGVDYLVLEEYVVETMRPQFRPLMADVRVLEQEPRLRLVYTNSDGPLTGVAILEVVHGPRR
jgi:hypothetical protein